jgi:signal transduction histidine kinase
MAVSVVRQAFGTGGGSVPRGVERRLAVAGVVVCAGAVTVAAASTGGEAAFGRGLLELLIIALPIAGGLYALRTPITSRFGIAMLIIGFGWSLTALGESSLSVPYTIGRLATWLIFPSVVYLLLAFPDGRIGAGLDRVLFVGTLALAAILFFGTAPLVVAYPQHTLWATCTTNCPANAVFVLDRQPGFMSTVILVREWLVMLLWVGLFSSMCRRWHAASPLQRVAMGPAVAVATVLGLCHIAFHATRELGAPAQTVITLSSLWTFCIVGLCAAFIFGLGWRRMLLAGALAKLGIALRDRGAPADVREALATALSDSTTELLFRDRGSPVWHDANGRVVTWPRPPAPGRASTEIGRDSEDPDVVLIHDVALQDDRELLDGVSGLALASWRHERLMSDLASALSDLEDSRRRIAKAADIERVRIERDLHDGLQQRLMGLRIRLDIAEDKIETDPRAGVREVRRLGFEADRALEELRSLALGVYPSLLTDHGLVDALRSVARQPAIPVHVSADGVTRHPIEIESGVYFTCVEALQNAMKHATTATGIWISLTQSSTELRFEVRDDGPGFTPSSRNGHGLRNMHDRIEAIHGRLSIATKRGHGTRVTGTVELPQAGAGS